MANKFVEGKDWRNVAIALDAIVDTVTDGTEDATRDTERPVYLNDIRHIADDLNKLSDLSFYTGEQIDEKLADKMDADQGSANAGKLMEVGSDGTVEPSTAKASDFLLANQGAGNVGKVLAVDSDGGVITVPAGTAGTTTAGDVAYINGTGYTSGSVGAAMETAEGDITQLKSDFAELGLSVVDGKLCMTYTVA